MSSTLIINAQISDNEEIKRILHLYSGAKYLILSSTAMGDLLYRGIVELYVDIDKYGHVLDHVIGYQEITRCKSDLVVLVDTRGTVSPVPFNDEISRRAKHLHITYIHIQDKVEMCGSGLINNVYYNALGSTTVDLRKIYTYNKGDISYSDFTMKISNKLQPIFCY
jgi:hypothetical protein